MTDSESPTGNDSTPQPDHYVVVGNPVEHSRSPQIHQAFAAQFDVVIEYRKIKIEPGGFASFADTFKAGGGCGMNITLPFKVDAFNYAQQTDPLATAAGAVNTLVFTPAGPSQGFNTDGVGLLADITQRHGFDLGGRRVLLLGAGGAASGLVQPLLSAGPDELVVANRTLANAQALVVHHKKFCAADVVMEARGFADLQGRYDLIINATSGGLSGTVAPIDPQLVREAFCYDMSYGDAAVFAGWADAQGAAVSVDGLGMLVEQAAQSFYLWRGVRPDTDPVIAQIRAEIRAEIKA